MALVIAWFSSDCVVVFVSIVIVAFGSATSLKRVIDVVWACGSMVMFFV